MILWILVLLLVVGWMGGFAFHVGGDLIHLLLVVAVVLIVYNVLVSNRRAL